MGGSTTSALIRATDTLMATITPNSLSSGIDDSARVPTPATAVMPDTMKARPVRRAVASMASRGARPGPRSSTNRNRISDVNSVQTATTNGPATAVTGLSLRLKATPMSDTAPTATSTGTSDSRARIRLRSRRVRKAPTKSSAR